MTVSAISNQFSPSVDARKLSKLLESKEQETAVVRAEKENEDYAKKAIEGKADENSSSGGSTDGANLDKYA